MSQNEKTNPYTVLKAKYDDLLKNHEELKAKNENLLKINFNMLDLKKHFDVEKQAYTGNVCFTDEFIQKYLA